MNGVAYFFSDKIAIRAARAVPVSAAQFPELHQIVKGLADRAGIPMPRLYVSPSPQPNAFATGRNPQHAAVAVTERLLQHLPPDLVKSVLAHEFGHIKNRDILVSSIAALVAGAIAATASLYAVNPLARQGVASLFATHPPVAERARRLRALDDDLALASPHRVVA
jgi:heat shock protein HtpX